MCLSLGEAELALAYLSVWGVSTGVAAAIGGVLWAQAERRGRSRWWDVPDGTVEDAAPAGGPFRSGGSVPRYLERAPLSLRVICYVAIVVGLWALPLLPIALVLLTVGGLGIFFSPLIYAGFALVSAARGLLLRREDAVERALSAANVVKVVCAIYLAMVGVMGLVIDELGILTWALAAPACLALCTARSLEKTLYRDTFLMPNELKSEPCQD
jgi:hypothetical protein